MTIAGQVRTHGVDRFAGCRLAARVYAADLADELEYDGGVLDLTVGWGTTSQPYRDLGRVVFGIDINRESEVADVHASSPVWLKKVESGICRRFAVVDWDPYGMATDISDVFFSNLWKFRLPLLLVAGCSLHATVVRGPQLDWKRHLGTSHRKARAALDAGRVHELYTQYIKGKTMEAGATLQHYCTISRPDGREQVVIGVIHRG